MIVASEFKPAPWLNNPHLQTLYASLLRPRPRLHVRRERIELPDGDFLDVDWTLDEGLPPNTPIVVFLHGLTGSIESKYVRGMMNRVRECGWRGVLMHFRGASEEPNRQPRGYHSGETEDINYFINLLHQREPGTAIAAVGFSLGGNVLLKWLGEQGLAAPMVTAVAVSVPFDLKICAEYIGRGFSRVYQAKLLRGMRDGVRRKFSRIQPPFPLPDLGKLRSFFEYDEALIAPLHGFASALDYYARCSSRKFLKHIRIPTLVIHASDDPFMSPDVVPENDELSDSVRLELSATGGHVAFVSADHRGRPRYWLESRIPTHLEEYLSDAFKSKQDSAKSATA